jgi:hypothetical protein
MTSKKRILLVAYHFPPLGLSGVGRPYALYRHLPDLGYDVTVLTVKNILYPQYDHSLLDKPGLGPVVRTGSLDPARILHLLGVRKIRKSITSLKTSLLNFPDSKRGWNLFARHEAARIVAHGKIDAVITTSPPPSSHLIGLKIKKSTGIPWIADFRDYWFSLPIELVYRRQIQKTYSLTLKRKIVERADELVSVNNDIKSYLNRGVVIMNGADASLAQFWRAAPRRDEKILRVGILGTLSHLTPVEPLFQAVSGLMKGGLLSSDFISLIHVGHYDIDMMQRQLHEYSMNETVQLKGYLPKALAFETLSSVDMLYFSVAMIGRYNILPGRIFDYFMSGKPILAVVPPTSDAARLLIEYDHGLTAAPGEIERVAQYLRETSEAKRKGLYNPKEKPTDPEKYSSLAVAKKYAELLNRILP